MEQKVKVSELPVATTVNNLQVLGVDPATNKSVKVPVPMLHEEGVLKSEEYSSVNYNEI